MPGQDVDRLIDQFVRQINKLPRRRVREEDIPVHLREGAAQYGLYYGWTIQRFPYVTWIEPIETRLQVRFPPVYRSLIARYIFPAFEVPPLMLLANTGQALYDELTYAVFRDSVLTQALAAGRLVQFARPSSGEYDPVCFDYNRVNADGDCPIVRLDPRTLLAQSQTRIVDEIAPSFTAFVEKYLAKPPARPKTPPAKLPQRSE
jgi:hypothetical protein